MLGWLRNLGRVEWQVPRPEPFNAAEWRLIHLQDRILQADRLIHARLTGDLSSTPTDFLLELKVALGTAPAADDEVPVIPGRTT